MNPRIRQKLDEMSERLQEVQLLLAQPETLSDGNRFRELARENSQLEELARDYAEYRRLESDLAATQAMAESERGEMREMAQAEAAELEQHLSALGDTLALSLVPADPRDERSLFLEIRAGTGGDEAAIFAGDLFRMYSRYAETRGWRVEVLSQSAGEHGGYKEIIARVEGAGAWTELKFESGTHRVQRVPETEAQGRIHTSACTVAILPELDEVDTTPLNPADLKVDTFRASGAGGQHVNKTDSAIRITHLPSGIVVECQDERSQHKNRARAMSLLQAKLIDIERSKQAQQQSEDRKLQVGSGDRSQRIRTYNFPQGRLTDHRINLTLYQLGDIIAGNLAPVIAPLQQEDRAMALDALLGKN
ncbi:MAG: peptide chain release factor 1 [Xanthomonadales bacterium]|nr:peptide chain release factor 1 [Xanthomonadales bacterium]